VTDDSHHSFASGVGPAGAATDRCCDNGALNRIPASWMADWSNQFEWPKCQRSDCWRLGWRHLRGDGSYCLHFHHGCVVSNFLLDAV